MDPYTGLVATRGLQMTETRGTNRQLNARSPHYSRVAITSLQIILPGWYLNSSLNETAPGAAYTVTASIEYPADTFTQVLFSGVASGTVPNGGYLVSDAVSVTIPTDTRFWVRTFIDATNLLIAVSGANGSAGATEGMQYEEAASGLTDKTLGGVIASSNSRVYAPVAIIGTTDQPTIGIVGDSIAFGFGDASAGLDIGPYARVFGPDYAYTKLCRTGDRISEFVSGHINREAMLAYCSHVIYAYGSNDLFVGSRTAAQVEADLETAAGYVAGKPVYVATLIPRTSSSDGWQTLANQSQGNATAEGHRITLNDALRGSTAFTRVWEIADTLESSRNSGWWLEALSSQFYTTDGIHPTSNGYALMEKAVSIAAPGSDGGTGVLTDAAGPSGGPFSQGGGGVMTEQAGPQQ